MGKGKYEPLRKTWKAGEVRRCIDACSSESQVELDIITAYLETKVKHNFGNAGALELLARLVEFGLIGEGPVDEGWMRRVHGKV